MRYNSYIKCLCLNGRTAQLQNKHYLLILRRCYINGTWYIACVLCRLAAPRLELHSNPIVLCYQYSESNVMHVLFSLLRIKGLYMFRALLVHPQKVLNKRHLVYCVRAMYQDWSAAPVLVQPTDITSTQYTKWLSPRRSGRTHHTQLPNKSRQRQ
jgi:hypothetical protein